MADYVFSVAGLAVIMSSISLLPQVLSVFQKKSIEGISPTFLAFDAVASILWIVYGRRLNDKATIISSSISLLLIAALGVAYYLYKNKPFQRRQQMEDERFQYGGPMMTHGEPPLAMPGAHHFAGASDPYRGSPDQRGGDYYDEEYAPQGDAADYGGGLFGGAMVTQGNEMSDY
jgi:MtN3 and saliva related transmembrane protein